MKFVRRLLLFILVIIVLVSSFIIFNGYSMYKNAISEVSLDKKVSNIRNDVNFVKIEDVPKYYLKSMVLLI